MKKILSLVLISGMALAAGPAPALAGAFVFSGETNGTGVITHPNGYTGTGGTVNVSVCIDPNSVNAANMVNSVRNAVATWNALSAVSPNLLFSPNNDVPASAVDFESAVVHELGHCIGLAHPNLATESGLPASQRDYTKSTDGADNAFDLGSGTDGIIGSADDARGDDVNLHWFNSTNNPCTTVIGTTDTSALFRGLGSLPGSDTFAANADRTVCNNLGFANTEAAMQQGQGSDEDQRDLGGDDVRTLGLGMSGLDETQGTADDYTVNLTYAGMTTACDIPIAFNNAETGFAVCQATGNFINSTHIEIDTAEIYYNSTANWYFNPFLGDPPECDAGPSYTAECDGTTTTLSLDGTGSSDPEGGSLDYAWTSDCPGATFDDSTSSSPALTVGTSPGCNVACGVDLTVTDEDGNAVTCQSTVQVTDTMAPTPTCPADVTIECTESTDPSSTGSAMATDTCDPTPGVAPSDAVTPGACPQEYTITRTWTATDGCGLSDSCDQIVEVVDTHAPVISCNAPMFIFPSEAPASFTATAVDNCDGSPDVQVLEYDCWWYNGAGKKRSKLESCVVEIDGATVSILDSGGVGDHIQWTVTTTDDCGNPAMATCEVEVVNPGQGKGLTKSLSLRSPEGGRREREVRATRRGGEE